VIDHGVVRKSYSEGRIFDLSKQTGRSPPTLRRWARQGVDLDDPEALKKFLERMDSRKPAFDRTKKRNFSRVRNRPAQTQAPSEQDSSASVGNGELAPIGKKGAQHALAGWNLRRNRRIAGCNLRFNAVIQLRSRALNSSGYAASRACENWIFRSSWPDATPNNRCRCDRLATLHCSFRTGSE
jgi:hypothetical protein